MKFARLSLFALMFSLILGVAETASSLQIPIVPNGTLGPFQHGTYPSKGDKTHAGVDILAPCGSDIYALADGQVIDLINYEYEPNFDSLGYMVIVQHPAHTLMDKQSYTVYLHMESPPLVTWDDRVIGSKSVLGKVGKTGVADTCHTHFEIRYFANRFSEWGNIYGPGDQRNAEHFKTNWDDPLVWFKKFPAGTTIAAEPREEEKRISALEATGEAKGSIEPQATITISQALQTSAPPDGSAGVVAQIVATEQREVRYPNGQLKERGHVVQDKEGNFRKVGKWTFWFDNGQKKAEGAFQDGKRAGLWPEWDRYGTKVVEGMYQDGRQTGLWRYWYSQGKDPDPGKSWLQEEKEFLNGVSNGLSTTWHCCEGKVKAGQGTYQKGSRTGRWTFWHGNGMTIKEGNFDNGEPIGVWTFYRENGEKWAEGQLKSPFPDAEIVIKRVGRWTFWFEKEGKRECNCDNPGWGCDVCFDFVDFKVPKQFR